MYSFHESYFHSESEISTVINALHFRWEDAKRAYLKFIKNEIIMRHPYTPRYTYSYTLIYTLHIEHTQNNRHNRVITSTLINTNVS